MSDPQPNTGAVIAAWWASHLGIRDGDSHSRGAARGLAARLRRAGPVEALAEPAVYELARALDSRDAARLYRVVAVLAHVRQSDGQRLARKFAGTLSELRFQRVIRAEGDDLAPAIIRALPMVEHSCNVAALAGDLWFWSDRVRTRWIFDYRGAALPEAAKETSQ